MILFETLFLNLIKKVLRPFRLRLLYCQVQAMKAATFQLAAFQLAAAGQSFHGSACESSVLSGDSQLEQSISRHCMHVCDGGGQWKNAVLLTTCDIVETRPGCWYPRAAVSGLAMCFSAKSSSSSSENWPSAIVMNSTSLIWLLNVLKLLFSCQRCVLLAFHNPPK